jgi:hypothetical protein
MKTIFYKKVGRKYVPVSEYDQTLMDALPKGTHMIQVYPGGQCTRYNVDPAYGPMIAAGRVAEDVISKALMQASDLRPKQAPLTEEQRAAWENLVKVFGPEAKCLEWPSAREACEKAVQAMTEEAKLLLENPSVKEAWDHFLFICELTKDRDGK